MLENLQLAKDALKGKSGIYAFVHIVTGTCYIGSSIDLADRIMDHINGYSSNQHLQYAIAKYGLSSFAFVILQYCIPSDLLEQEQLFFKEIFFFFFSLTDPGVPLIKKRSTGPGGPDYLNLRLSKLFLIVRVLDSV
jgi:group I intron endonuclease